MENKLRFSKARELVLSMHGCGNDIGRLSEKALHRILKYYIEPNPECHEIPFLGNVADIKNSEGIFEIQTRSAEKLNPKLLKFLPETGVTVVFPLALEKKLSWIDTEKRTISEPHKSPKKEGIFDALFELSKIKRHISHENFHLKLIYLSVSEFRYLNGYDKSRKHGSTRCERIPNYLLDEIDFKNTAELRLYLLPYLPKGDFTAKDFKKLTKRTERKNFYILRLLADIGAISMVGKRGRAFLYNTSVHDGAHQPCF